LTICGQHEVPLETGQRTFYAIVDEVDSILIDRRDALSSPASPRPFEFYNTSTTFCPKLTRRLQVDESSAR